MTRRELLGCAGLTAAGLAQAGANDSVVRETLVTYRASAVVLMLSVPVYTRSAVGGACLRIVESQGRAGRRVDLEFAAGSLPERAAGLNRLGLFEESVVEHDGVPASATYFGFMTSSNEKTLAEARVAMKNVAGAAGDTVTAIRGRIEGGRVWNQLARLQGLSGVSWREYRKLRNVVRDGLGSTATQDREFAVSVPGGPRTFLYAVQSALTQGVPVSTQSFVHNGELLTLRTERAHTESRTGLVVLHGHIQHPSGRRLSSFQVWFDPNAPTAAPVKFELRARSFLRLTFERNVAQA